MNNALFRPEVVQTAPTKLEGRIVLPSQANLTMVAIAGVLILLGLIAYAALGEYTRKAKLVGLVMPVSGLIKVVAPLDSRVQTQLVQEGQLVHKGDPLFILSGESYNSDGVATLEKMRASIQEQVALVKRERARRIDLNRMETAALVRRNQNLDAEYAAAKSALAIAQKRAQLQASMLARNSQLVTQGFISASAQQQQEILVVTAQGDVEQNRQSLFRLQQEQQTAQADLQQAALSGENALAELDQRARQLEQQLIELARRDASMIRAPATGIATGILAKTGQAMQENEALLSLVPQGSELVVELYAASQSVGFIKPGQRVGLRFQAFPYEKYGIQQGVVREVARAAQPPTELAQRALLNLGSDNQGYYRVVVGLSKPTVTVQGRDEQLKAGMSAQGDVFLDTRKIYEWLFEPIATLTGK